MNKAWKITMKLWKTINWRSDRGVTFPEILITLLLFSVIALLLLRIGSRLLLPLDEEGQRATVLRREIQYRRLLAREMEALAPAWWLSVYKWDQSGNSWTFPWYGGVEDQNLMLELTEEGLWVHPPDMEEESPGHLLGGIESISIDEALNVQGAPYALWIELEGVVEARWLLPLGSVITPPQELEPQP